MTGPIPDEPTGGSGPPPNPVAPLPRPTGDGLVKPPHGLVDPMSRRSAADAMRGHFCVVDLLNLEALAAVEEVTGDAGRYRGRAFGVFHRPLELDDESGFPLTAMVELRDDFGGGMVTVPYAALSPAPPGVTRLR